MLITEIKVSDVKRTDNHRAREGGVSYRRASRNCQNLTLKIYVHHRNKSKRRQKN